MKRTCLTCKFAGWDEIKAEFVCHNPNSMWTSEIVNSGQECMQWKGGNRGDERRYFVVEED